MFNNITIIDFYFINYNNLMILDWQYLYVLNGFFMVILAKKNWYWIILGQLFVLFLNLWNFFCIFFNSSWIFALLPEISLILFVICFLLVIIFDLQKTYKINIINIISILTCSLLWTGFGQGFWGLFIIEYNDFFDNVGILNNFIITTSILCWIKIFFTLVLAFVLWYSKYYVYLKKIIQFEYVFFLIFILFSLWCAISTVSFIILYIVLELQALCFLLLIISTTSIVIASQTALRYGIINFIASLFFLYGIIRLKLVYIDVDILLLGGCLTNNKIYNLILIFNNLYIQENPLNYIIYINDLIVIKIIIPNFFLIFILLGLLIKIGVGPFAFWIPGVYNFINLPTLIVFSTLPKLLYTYLWINLIINNIVIPFKNNLYIICILISLFSLFYGIFGLFNENYNIFRFIGWSTITNFSLIFLAIAQINISWFLEQQKIKFFVIFFLITYIISILLFLGSFLFIFYNKNIRGIIKFTDLQFINRHYNWYFLIIIGVISLLNFFGLPPFIGFWGKFLLIKSLVINSNQLFNVLIIFVFIVTLVGSFTYIKLYNSFVTERYKELNYITILNIPVYWVETYFVFFIQIQLLVIFGLIYWSLFLL